LYFPAAGRLQVVHADHPTGPGASPSIWASVPSTLPT
jgi:hypothetical protein